MNESMSNGVKVNIFMLLYKRKGQDAEGFFILILNIFIFIVVFERNLNFGKSNLRRKKQWNWIGNGICSYFILLLAISDQITNILVLLQLIAEERFRLIFIGCSKIRKSAITLM